MILVSSLTGEHRDHALSLLRAPCVHCHRAADVMLLLDTKQDMFNLCVDCGDELGISILDATPMTVAVLSTEEWADTVAMYLALARNWHLGRVPLTRRRLFNVDRWARA